MWEREQLCKQDGHESYLFLFSGSIIVNSVERPFNNKLSYIAKNHKSKKQKTFKKSIVGRMTKNWPQNAIGNNKCYSSLRSSQLHVAF